MVRGIKRKLKEKAILLASKNTETTNFQKASEELLELALELVQRVNKPHKINDEAIIKEIADVKIRLWYLEQRFGKNSVKTAVHKKLKSLNHVNIRRRSNPSFKKKS
jgi:NTP pyrophosphatase (non-canonical NTP hydrolase)